MENIMFDYRSFGENSDVPVEIINAFEKEAQNEFPFDKMLMELHVLRAMQSYVKILLK